MENISVSSKEHSKEDYKKEIDELWEARKKTKKGLNAMCDICLKKCSMTFCDCAKALFVHLLTIEELEKIRAAT